MNIIIDWYPYLNIYMTTFIASFSYVSFDWLIITINLVSRHFAKVVSETYLLYICTTSILQVSTHLSGIKIPTIPLYSIASQQWLEETPIDRPNFWLTGWCGWHRVCVVNRDVWWCDFCNLIWVGGGVMVPMMPMMMMVYFAYFVAHAGLFLIKWGMFVKICDW